jgi:hypothetical protein
MQPQRKGREAAVEEARKDRRDTVEFITAPIDAENNETRRTRKNARHVETRVQV